MSAAEKPTTYTELAGVLGALPMLLREARRSRGLSLRATAEQVGIDFNTLRRIEVGGQFNTKALLPILRWLDQTTTHKESK